MPIPQLDARGFLPAGVHRCSLEEVRERFGSFQGTDRRVRLFEQLESYVAEARCTGVVRAVVVDGSFVTSKRDPSDIDLVVVLPRELPSGPVSPSVYNATSRRRIRKKFPFDVLVAADGSVEYDRFVEFFAQIKEGPGLEKGLLRVEL